eukprot:TRINITY_DN7829_c0_g1_i16.p1 TRINITY_DN7829_c0_g1~~TRINITY_DN7829_c0_g1_i16.p1  ORF type:complete len:243 (-),score=51.14 TRINITY_DN7829_c0_g1_i16:279-1007(-)
MACGCFLKGWIYTSAVLIALFGIAIEVLFIMLACGRFAEATESKGVLIATGTIIVVLMLTIATFGCCGAYKKSTCLLITYAVIAALMFAGLWIAFSRMKKGKDNVRKDMDMICNGQAKSGFLNDMNEVYKNGGKSLSSIFCSSSCTCKGDPAKFSDYTGLNMETNSGSSTVSSCSPNPVAGRKKAVLSFLGWLEEKKDCSGICNKEKFYYFSDVNRGVPPKACRQPVLDYINSIFASNRRMV